MPVINGYRLFNRIIVCVCVLLFSRSVFSNDAYQSALKVASMNLCADQFLLLLAKPNNIVGLSDLAADKQFSYLWDKVGDTPLTDGAIEDILPLAPGLVIAGEYDDKHRINLLRAFGLTVEIIPLVENLDEVYSSLLSVSKLIGEENRGVVLVEALKQRVNDTVKNKLDVDSDDKKVAVIYAANGFTHGRGTIHDELIRLAGFKNGASEAGLQGHGNLSLEQLLKIQPALLIMEDSSDNKNSNAQRILKHPALVRGLPNTRIVDIPANLWMCGGPSSIDVLEQLVSFQQELNEHNEVNRADR